jgi:hypothetical protein
MPLIVIRWTRIGRAMWVECGSLRVVAEVRCRRNLVIGVCVH